MSVRSGREAPLIAGATFVVAIFAWGLAFYGLGCYLQQQQLHRRFGCSVSSLSVVTLVFHLTATAASFAVSGALRRLGPRPVFGCGALLLASGVSGVGRLDTRWELIGW